MSVTPPACYINANMGRPSKLDDLTAQKVINAVKNGLPRVHAARNAGVDPTTLFRWLRLGRKGDPDFCQFYQRVAAAESTSVEVLHGYMQEHAKVSHQACAWLLERRGGKAYAPKKGDLALTVTPAEADALIAEAAKLAAK